MSARAEVLARVRAAIAHGGDSAGEQVPRDYRTRTDDGVETFVDRLRDYGAGTRRVLTGSRCHAPPIFEPQKPFDLGVGKPQSQRQPFGVLHHVAAKCAKAACCIGLGADCITN